MVPVYQKPATKRRNGKPGAKNGHAGIRRKTPPKIDRHFSTASKPAPAAAASSNVATASERTVEDILEDLRTVVTEHTVHRDYCPACKKHVEPVVPDALPNAKIGHNVVALSAWLHYGVGVSISQVRELLGGHPDAPVGRRVGVGLAAACRSARTVVRADRHRRPGLGRAARRRDRLADERQDLVAVVLRQQLTCYYMLDPSRGSPALEKFFAEAFDGVLVTDFWAA